jgi:O-antigen/teichoic acid export membrane protein
MPLLILSQLALGVVNGKQQWSRLMSLRMIPTVIGVASTVVLFLLNRLTVQTASAFMIGAIILTALASLTSLPAERHVSFDPATARGALRFGPAAWLWQLGSLTNARLDQLLMVSLSTSRQLGLYAVAVTASGAATVFVAALGPALLPRIARGDHEAAPRVFRRALLATTITAAGGAAVAPVVFPLVFGAAFARSVPMLEILLAAAIPATGLQVLTSALLGANSPKWAAAAEGTAVLVTVPGLILLLPHFGGIGAASVSLIAYSVSVAVLLVGSHRRFGFPLRDFLVPRHDDFVYLARLGVRFIPSPLRARFCARGRSPDGHE